MFTIRLSGRYLFFIFVFALLLIFGRSEANSNKIHANAPVISPNAAAAGGVTIRVSVDSEGSEAHGFSNYPAISADGRFVVFDSFASSLVPEDTNENVDVFIHDRQKRTTQLVSVNLNGSQANGGSVEPAISANGRFVAFMSSADNLAAGDTNEDFDIFVCDRQTGVTKRESISSSGKQASGYSAAPTISADGHIVAFMSSAVDLVPDDNNDKYDVFVRDREAQTTKRISVNSDGTQGNNHASIPAISADGRFVAFLSLADNLVSGDTNGVSDIFIHDLQTNTTDRVSVGMNGTQSSAGSFEPAISGDGRFVLFSSAAADLVPGDTNEKRDIFIHDRQTGLTERVSVDSSGRQANDDSFEPAVSADGSLVAFRSQAGNLVANDTNDEDDIFIHNRETGETERLSAAASSGQADGGSFVPDITADGRQVTFMSFAANLVPDDSNDTADIFVHDRYTTYDLFLPVIFGK